MAGQAQERYTHGYDPDRYSFRTADRQGAFILPHLHPGMSILDCGCGPGNITFGLAKAVSPGVAEGIDIEKGQVEAAQAHAASRGVANIRFQEASLYGIPFPDESFDAVFSHGVLEYLNDPLKAIGEMKRVIKKGGVIALSCGDTGAFLIGPPDPYLDQFFDVWEKVNRNTGRNPRIGRILPSLVRESGFEHMKVSASYILWSETPETTLTHARLCEGLCRSSWMAEQALELGFANEAALDRMAGAWNAWSESPDAFIAEPRGEVLAWKE